MFNRFAKEEDYLDGASSDEKVEACKRDLDEHALQQKDESDNEVKDESEVKDEKTKRKLKDDNFKMKENDPKTKEREW